MAAAYHVSLSAYGFWLPNDPRGSWSTKLGNRGLRKFGAINGHRTKQKINTEQKQMINAERRALIQPPIRFTGKQAQLIGHGFGRCKEQYKLIIWACAILPNHTHLVLAHHPTLTIEQIVNQLKGAATRALNKAGLNPRQFQTCSERIRLPPIWARNFGKYFKNTDEQIFNAVTYAERNPEKEGKPQQNWSFVTRFRGLKFKYD
jgi:REP element-mobilizing transposase RayT